MTKGEGLIEVSKKVKNAEKERCATSFLGLWGRLGGLKEGVRVLWGEIDNR